MTQNESDPRPTVEVHNSETSGNGSTSLGFPDLFEVLRAQGVEQFRSYVEYASTPAYLEHLQRAYRSLAEAAEFRPGDVVQWKTFMRDQRFPDYGAPAIVLRRLDSPLQPAGRTEPVFPLHDLLLGLLDADQDFITVSAASGRLMPWKPEGAINR